MRALATPFVKAGMVLQVDIHALPSSTGVLNLHAHFLMTLRRIEGGEFSTRKPRDWNRMFYRDPRQLRADLAAILTAFCAQHGVSFEADARSNAEKGLPPPEMTIPRWNVLAFRRSGKRTTWMRQIDREREAKRQLAEMEGELAAVNLLLDEERRQVSALGQLAVPTGNAVVSSSSPQTIVAAASSTWPLPFPGRSGVADEISEYYHDDVPEAPAQFCLR